MPPFTPDQRNVGGRSLILNQMFNHRQYLNQASAQIHTSYSPQIISPKTKQHSQNYSNVINTFKKVQEIQRKKPQFSPTNIYRLIKQKQKDEEHQTNLKSQKKRIQDITSLQNRRKNPSDYLLFPTFLFRRKTISQQVALTPSPKKKAQAQINIYSLHQPVDYVDSNNEQTVLLFNDPIKVPFNQSIKKRNKPQLFPYSTAQLGQLYKVKSIQTKKKQINMEMQLNQGQYHYRDWSSIRIELSEFKAESIEELHNYLKQLIADNGIYTVRHYEQLIKIVQQQFPRMSKQEIIQIFNDLILAIQSDF